MENYQLPGSKRALYNKLAAAGLLDTSKISAEQLLPPYNGKLPQPFYSAPGSGYASHHAYPGGLATHTAANLCISEGIYNTYKDILTATSAAILSFPHRHCTIWQNRWYSSGRKPGFAA